MLQLQTLWQTPRRLLADHRSQMLQQAKAINQPRRAVIKSAAVMQSDHFRKASSRQEQSAYTHCA